MPISPQVSAEVSGGHLEAHDLLAALIVITGLAGVVLVFLPGIALQVAGVTIWAFAESSGLGWVVFFITVAIAFAASLLKYLHPGRQLKAAGIPSWMMITAVTAAIAGFFIVPVIGAPLAFVLTIYLFERRRKGRSAAWPSTRIAVRAVATSVGIELTGAFAILSVFLVGTVLT